MKRRFWMVVVFVALLILIGIIGIGEISVKYVLSREENSTGSFGENKVYLTSADGLRMVALEMMSSKVSHQWAILVHSYRTDHRFMNPYAKSYQEQGYNTLQLDNRALGKSEGDYIGRGYLDQYDVLFWIDYIIEKDPEAEIVLHGVSMGAASLMMLSGQENIPANVKVIIEDCGCTSARDYLSWKLKQLNNPGFVVLPQLSVSPIPHISQFCF